MRKVFRAFLAVIPFLVLASCATTLITQDALQPVRRGMSHAEFKTHITAEPSAAFAVDFEDESYPIEIYDMQTGTETVHGSTYVWNQYGGYTIPTTTTVPVTDEFVFIFDPEGLAYWGFINEMQKEDDELIQELAPIVLAGYEKEKKAANEKYQKMQQEQQQQRGNR